ncbi:MAG: M23 family metallopeptidase [Bacteroidales bacterium]|nr:M23 family metallopeptidase [Bacteroidales bacterium]
MRRRLNLTFWRKLWKHPYRLVIMDDQTLGEMFSLRLSGWNVVVVVGLVSLLLVVLTTFVIAFTPLREYIPGYGDVKEKSTIIRLSQKADSLERIMQVQEQFLMRFVRLLSMTDTSLATTLISYRNELGTSYNVQTEKQRGIRNVFLVKPLANGILLNDFDVSKGHYGIDLTAEEGSVAVAVDDGVVIFADWTVQGGNTIILQHTPNMISIYMHNSLLLKRKGDAVLRGEPISVIGNTGKNTTGVHLHFELWYNLMPVNPSHFFAI